MTHILAILTLWLSLSRPWVAPGELVTVTLADAPIGASVAAPAGFALVSSGDTGPEGTRTAWWTYRLDLAPPGPAWFCAAGSCAGVTVRGTYAAYAPHLGR